MHYADGSDAGQASYIQTIKIGDIVHVGNGRRLRMLDIVPVVRNEKSRIVGMLKVEAEPSGDT